MVLNGKSHMEAKEQWWEEVATDVMIELDFH